MYFPLFCTECVLFYILNGLLQLCKNKFFSGMKVCFFKNMFLLTGIVSSMSLPAWKFIYICILIVGEYLPFYLSFIYQRQLIFDVADVSGCFEAAGCAKTQALICLLKRLNNSVWFLLFFFCYLSYFTIHTFISYFYLLYLGLITLTKYT